MCLPSSLHASSSLKSCCAPRPLLPLLLHASSWALFYNLTTTDRRVLKAISQYVRYDLKALTSDPAVLLSSRPVDDPLESIMYLTSVGVPSSVYETVRSLRQARAQRLGALQRKLPYAHMVLLWILAAIELVSFPLLGAGTQVIGGYKILTVEGILFGVMTAGIVLTLKVGWCGALLCGLRKKKSLNARANIISPCALYRLLESSGVQQVVLTTLIMSLV